MRKGKKYGRFVENRRKKLNAFLQELLESPHTCDDELFRDFLSPDEIMSDEEDGFDTSDEDVLDTFFAEETNVSTPQPTVTTPRSRSRVGARCVASNGEVVGDDDDDDDDDDKYDGNDAKVEEKEERKDSKLKSFKEKNKQGLKITFHETRRGRGNKKKKKMMKKSPKAKTRKEDKASAISPSAVRDIIKFTWKLTQELFELYVVLRSYSHMHQLIHTHTHTHTHSLTDTTQRGSIEEQFPWSNRWPRPCFRDLHIVRSNVSTTTCSLENLQCILFSN